ncbi:MAG TPA: UDP-2,3-diacylglucosamine diphosphatase [Prolixibacteraceae bacterium]|nr:UDP-2,3-diacylglucosamine diphosphatase [Prolixibacteraceae bacterium]
MSASKKTYFVSDVHLGAPAFKNNHERELLFARWLDDIKPHAGALYLMGDIFDFWYEYNKVVPRGFTRILGRIAGFSDDGIPVHFFTGNHDLWVFDYIPQETGATLHRNELITEISGKKFFLAHGDGIDPDDKGYHFLKKIFTNKGLQWAFSRLHPNLALMLAHKWSKSSRLSKIDFQDEFEVNNEGMYKFAENILQKESIDYFIFGHRHLMLDTEIGASGRFILLGDWIKNFSFGVFDGEKFELKQYKD